MMTKQIKIVAVGIVLLMQGQLTQARTYLWTQEIPGSWNRSCWYASVNNNVLTAQCGTLGGNLQQSSINLSGVSAVGNNNGQLVPE